MEKDNYQLASRLMFLEITNSRKSKYKLQRLFLRYGWSRLQEEELKPIRKLKYLYKKKQPNALQHSLNKHQKKVTNFIDFFKEKYTEN